MTTDEKIFVGSVKTVIGHLEGAAGLAGLLRASLAVQHGQVPPNMWFEQLNPEIDGFYNFLEVPTKLTTWPDLRSGLPRRASINSFGFGGTNAHAIIESWDPQTNPSTKVTHSSAVCHGPFIVSANSEISLKESVASLCAHIKATGPVDLSRLSWTLQNHRTPHNHRASFSGSSESRLVAKLEEFASREVQSVVTNRASTIKASTHIRVFGIFTGQGAQWPGMGASLYQRSYSFRHTIDNLEDVLQRTADAPTWSLSEELLAVGDKSRISSSEFSQPLCIALQIGLVNLLRESGVTFSGVIGHSSGEIAAAYAAGFLDAAEAIQVAYYRGLHTHSAISTKTEAGKMMAVALNLEQAERFCQRPELSGRIAPAASNSGSSTTLSGDASAIEQAKRILDEENVFARVLRVDKAYHSSHSKQGFTPSTLSQLRDFPAGLAPVHLIMYRQEHHLISLPAFSAAQLKKLPRTGQI